MTVTAELIASTRRLIAPLFSGEEVEKIIGRIVSTNDDTIIEDILVTLLIHEINEWRQQEAKEEEEADEEEKQRQEQLERRRRQQKNTRWSAGCAAALAEREGTPCPLPPRGRALHRSTRRS